MLIYMMETSARPMERESEAGDVKRGEPRDDGSFAITPLKAKLIPGRR